MLAGHAIGMGLGPARGVVPVVPAGGAEGGGQRAQDHLSSGRHGRGLLLLDWGAEIGDLGHVERAEFVGTGSNGHFAERPVHAGVAAGELSSATRPGGPKPVGGGQVRITA